MAKQADNELYPCGTECGGLCLSCQLFFEELELLDLTDIQNAIKRTKKH